MIGYFFFTLLAQPAAADAFPRVELSQFIEEQQPKSLGCVKSDVDFFKVELDPMVHVKIDADGSEILSNGTHFISTPDHDNWQNALIQAGLLTIESTVAENPFIKSAVNNMPLHKRYKQTAVNVLVSNFTALLYNASVSPYKLSNSQFLYGIDQAIQSWKHNSKAKNKDDSSVAVGGPGYMSVFSVVDGDRKSNFNEICIVSMKPVFPSNISIPDSACIRIYSQKSQRHWTIAYGKSGGNFTSSCSSFETSFTSGESLCNLMNL